MTENNGMVLNPEYAIEQLSTRASDLQSKAGYHKVSSFVFAMIGGLASVSTALAYSPISTPTTRETRITMIAIALLAVAKSCSDFHKMNKTEKQLLPIVNEIERIKQQQKTK